MSNRRLVLASACVVVAAFAGCTAPNLPFQAAKEEYSDADFFQAWNSINQALEQEPDNPDVRAAYEEIRIAFLLKRAQQRIFQSREVEALEDLERVLVLDPGNPIADRLILKAESKLAGVAATAGDQLRIEGDLEGALVKYHEALELTPGLDQAEEGLQAVAETWRKLRESARSHYLDGVRALAEQLFQQTEYHMLLALEMDPTMEEARAPADLASRRLAEERYAAAKVMEERGFFKPALREYEEIHAEYPGFDGIDDRIESTQAEVEAEELLRKGSSAAFRGEFGEARDYLEQAMQLTQRQRDEIAETLVFVHEREVEERYTLAKDEELQGRFEAALEAYRLIDQEAPGYLDVRARVSDLEIRIEEAQKAYDAGLEAEKAGDKDAAIGHYTDVMLYWPKYRDAADRLKKLRGDDGSS